jgi:hypothetical protein
MSRRSLTVSHLTLAICGVLVSSSVGSAPQFHFAISESFMQTLAGNAGLLPTTTITMDARSGVHTVASDCEIHVGGSGPGRDRLPFGVCGLRRDEHGPVAVKSCD